MNEQMKHFRYQFELRVDGGDGGVSGGACFRYFIMIRFSAARFTINGIIMTFKALFSFSTSK